MSDDQVPDPSALSVDVINLTKQIATLAQHDPTAARAMLMLVNENASSLEKIMKFAERGTKQTGEGPQSNGSHRITNDTKAPIDVSDAMDPDPALDKLGRNMRSKVREAVLLEIIYRGGGPFSLQQLMAALEARRWKDNQNVVVSHLHRMKDAELIDHVGSGTYNVTAAGLQHLQKLRTKLGALLPPDMRN